MNTILALMAFIVGVLASLAAFKVIKLENFVGLGEAEAWHDKYGKIFKIAGPAAVVVGLILLIWR